MASFVRRMRKRKRSLGEVRVLRREEYEGLELNAKVELIRSLIPLGLMHVQALLDDEVELLAGRRYARTDGTSGTRHGSNPGTVVLDGQRVPIRVPRVRVARRTAEPCHIPTCYIATREERSAGRRPPCNRPARPSELEVEC